MQRVMLELTKGCCTKSGSFFLQKAAQTRKLNGRVRSQMVMQLQAGDCVLYSGPSLIRRRML